tara:strand:- start:2348 stop:2920 length:573 start_codon:yes stop_codon:yes gene_type:complete
MTQYEYKVVPAPAKGLKGEGVKGPEARFANALEGLMNQLAADGWEYLRADTLPSTERSGLTGSTTEWRNMLIFRRAVAHKHTTVAPVSDSPAVTTPPVTATPLVATAPKVDAEEKPQALPEDTTTTADVPLVDTDADVDPDEQKTPRAGATHMLSDNGVEETSEVSGMSSSLQNLASNRSRLKGVTRNDK